MSKRQKHSREHQIQVAIVNDGQFGGREQKKNTFLSGGEELERSSPEKKLAQTQLIVEEPDTGTFKVNASEFNT